MTRRLLLLLAGVFAVAGVSLLVVSVAMLAGAVL